MKCACILAGIILLGFRGCGTVQEPTAKPPQSRRPTSTTPKAEEKTTKPEATKEATQPTEPGKLEGALPPPASGASEATTTPKPSGAKPSAPTAKSERNVEIVRYDPNADLDLSARYLDKIGSLIERRRYNEMRVYVARLSRTLIYLEGHLPTVSLQVGLERVQTLLSQNQGDKAAAEIQRILAEVRSLPALAPSSNTVAALRDIAENLESGGDIDTAREAISGISFSLPTDPSAIIQEIRSSLTSLEIAISREAPGVIQTQLDSLRSLLSKLRAALSPPTSAMTTSSTPPAKPSG